MLATRSKKMEQFQYRAKNLTGEDWEFRGIGRVPVSEQEDLVVTWSADPQPTGVDYEDRRGVLSWEQTLKANSELVVNMSTLLEWPGGWELEG